MGSISGRDTGILHAAEQVGLRAATTVSHRPHLESPRDQGKIPRDKMKIPRVATETQHSQKERSIHKSQFYCHTLVMGNPNMELRRQSHV